MFVKSNKVMVRACLIWLTRESKATSAIIVALHGSKLELPTTSNIGLVIRHPVKHLIKIKKLTLQLGEGHQSLPLTTVRAVPPAKGRWDVMTSGFSKVDI